MVRTASEMESRPPIMEVHLRELPCDVLATSIAAIGERKVSSDLARRIAEHTEGNPLFAIELMNLLKERNLITDQRDGRSSSYPPRSAR